MKAIGRILKTLRLTAKGTPDYAGDSVSVVSQALRTLHRNQLRNREGVVRLLTLRNGLASQRPLISGNARIVLESRIDELEQEISQVKFAIRKEEERFRKATTFAAVAKPLLQAEIGNQVIDGILNALETEYGLIKPEPLLYRRRR